MNEAAKKVNTPVDPDELYAALEEKIRRSGHPMDLGRIRAAYDMAKLAHAGQISSACGGALRISRLWPPHRRGSWPDVPGT